MNIVRCHDSGELGHLIFQFKCFPIDALSLSGNLIPHAMCGSDYTVKMGMEGGLFAGHHNEYNVVMFW